MKRYVLISEDRVVETDTTSLARAKQYVEAALVDKPTGYTVAIYQHVLTGSKTGVIFNKDGCTKRTTKKKPDRRKPGSPKTRVPWTDEEIGDLNAWFLLGRSRHEINHSFPRHTPTAVDSKRKKLGLLYK